MILSPIHPFPARMATDIAWESLKDVPKRVNVLDPMCGSGTVVRTAVEMGHRCTGVDIDPLAVLMTQVWVTSLSCDELREIARCLIEKARGILDTQVQPISDPETESFINFWFAPSQKNQLMRLATVLNEQPRPVRDALAISMSRIIVTKEMKASLARDTSHSRPHRVARENNFDVYEGFQKSVDQVVRRLAPERIEGKARVIQGDARCLYELQDDTFDIAITSPPYLNAIDYLRGHKLTLVWLGYDLSDIRSIRSKSVGAERKLDRRESMPDISQYITESSSSKITDRHLGWIRRYAVDMNSILRELARLIKPRGRVIMVVGNSFLRGAGVRNAVLVEDLAKLHSFVVESKRIREIPARRRYLPPPGNGKNSLDTRIRKETVIRLRASV